MKIAVAIIHILVVISTIRFMFWFHDALNHEQWAEAAKYGFWSLVFVIHLYSFGDSK